MFGLGPTEMIIFGVVAVLLFGSRLPDVARSMGKSLTEFKKGMAGVENDVRDAVYSEPADSIDNRSDWDDHQEPASKAFEPPQAESEIDAEAEAERGDAQKVDAAAP